MQLLYTRTIDLPPPIRSIMMSPWILCITIDESRDLTGRTDHDNPLISVRP
jgi:hypothetical protein